MHRQYPGGMSRRHFCVALGSTLAGLSCRLGTTETSGYAADNPRLLARFHPPSANIAPGLYQFQTGTTTSFIVVPENYRPANPVPLVVALHGAGITADGPRAFLGPYAESDGFVLVIPESADFTWDAIHGVYGPDLVTIDAALGVAFRYCAIDPARICLEGFSDGASYALGVGITNPEIFTHVVAFSPGLVTRARSQPRKPRIFVSHGLQDTVLPIDLASRRIVPELEAEGYDVEYVEYDGVHSVPPAIARAAVDFWMRA